MTAAEPVPCTARSPGSHGHRRLRAVHGGDEQSEARVRTAYGLAEYERLARIERDDDPGNVSHRNADVLPTAAPAERVPTGMQQATASQG